MRSSVLAIAAAMLVATATASFAQSAFNLVASADGKVLAGPQKMTLYTFDKDTKGQSNCYDKCAVNWPPFLAGPGARPANRFSLVKRKDGKLQWAIEGKPLYYWKNDKKPGDTKGNGVLGVWHVVK